MSIKIKAIQNLVSELSRLPGVGARSASRIAFYFVEKEAVYAERISDLIKEIKTQVAECPDCYSYMDVKMGCEYCSATNSRDFNQICVVEKPQDVLTLEKSGYKGLYHVLKGLIAPLDGVGPEDIKIRELTMRIQKINLTANPIKEVIIALNPSVEGDATTMYIANGLCRLNVRVTKLARGVPAGASIDYLDGLTLCRAIEDRQSI